jgi:hypothetical protein
MSITVVGRDGFQVSGELRVRGQSGDGTHGQLSLTNGRGRTRARVLALSKIHAKVAVNFKEGVCGLTPWDL